MVRQRVVCKSEISTFFPTYRADGQEQGFFWKECFSLKVKKRLIKGFNGQQIKRMLKRKSLLEELQREIYLCLARKLFRQKCRFLLLSCSFSLDLQQKSGNKVSEVK